MQTQNSPRRNRALDLVNSLLAVGVAPRQYNETVSRQAIKEVRIAESARTNGADDESPSISDNCR